LPRDIFGNRPFLAFLDLVRHERLPFLVAERDAVDGAVSFDAAAEDVAVVDGERHAAIGPDADAAEGERIGPFRLPLGDWAELGERVIEGGEHFLRPRL